MTSPTLLISFLHSSLKLVNYSDHYVLMDVIITMLPSGMHIHYQTYIFVNNVLYLFIQKPGCLCPITDFNPAYEPFLHFSQAFICFRVLNHCVCSGPGVCISPAFVLINVVHGFSDEELSLHCYYVIVSVFFLKKQYCKTEICWIMWSTNVHSMSVASSISLSHKILVVLLVCVL